MNEIKASIVIPTRDKLSRLLLVLKTLEKQITAEIEVIVIFDGCKPEIIQNFKQQKFSFDPTIIINKENIGSAATRNRGIERASGKTIIFLDDDRIPSEDFVKKHIDGQKEPCIILGKRYDVSLDENEIERLFLTEHEYIYQQVKNNSSVAIESGDYYKRKSPLRGTSRWMLFWTGNVSVPKKILNEVGNFNESFIGSGYEDIELGYRLSKKDILFKQDFNIINYHLQHPYYNNNRYNETKKNYKILMKTCRGGGIATIWMIYWGLFFNWWKYYIKPKYFTKV